MFRKPKDKYHRVLIMACSNGFMIMEFTLATQSNCRGEILNDRPRPRVMDNLHYNKHSTIFVFNRSFCHILKWPISTVDLKEIIVYHKGKIEWKTLYFSGFMSSFFLSWSSGPSFNKYKNRHEIKRIK